MCVSVLSNIINAIIHFSAGGIVAPYSYYPQGAGSIWLDDVQCLGTEPRLLDCPNPGIGINDCSHFEDVGVMCGKPQYIGGVVYSGVYIVMPYIKMSCK